MKSALIIITPPSNGNSYFEEAVQRISCPFLGKSNLPTARNEVDLIYPLKLWLMQDKRNTEPFLLFDGAIFNLNRAEALIPFLKLRGFKIEVLWVAGTKNPLPKELADTKYVFTRWAHEGGFHEMDASKPALIRRKLALMLGVPSLAPSLKRKPAMVQELATEHMELRLATA